MSRVRFLAPAAVLLALPAAACPAMAAAPVAVVDGPATATTGVPVAFDAQRSSDPDGDPLRFQWTIDGQELGVDDAWLSVSFAKPGKHVVAVTVIDATGGADVAQRAVVTTGADRGSLSSLPGIPSPVGPKLPEVAVAPPADRLRRHSLRIELRCRNTARCQGVLRATAVIRGRLRLLGSTRFSAPKGGPRVLRVKLSRRARRLLGARTVVRMTAYRGYVADKTLWDTKSYVVKVRR